MNAEVHYPQRLSGLRIGRKYGLAYLRHPQSDLFDGTTPDREFTSSFHCRCKGPPYRGLLYGEALALIAKAIALPGHPVAPWDIPVPMRRHQCRWQVQSIADVAGWKVIDVLVPGPPARQGRGGYRATVLSIGDGNAIQMKHAGPGLPLRSVSTHSCRGGNPQDEP